MQLVSIWGPLGHEPNTPTTAPLRRVLRKRGGSTFEACWRCLLEKPAGDACWRCLLEKLAGDACWRCLLEMLAVDACWRCLLEMLAGDACWRCLLEMLAGDACWRCLLEMPAGDVLILSSGSSCVRRCVRLCSALCSVTQKNCATAPPGSIIYCFVLWGGGRADLRDRPGSGSATGIASRHCQQALPAGIASRHCRQALPAGIAGRHCKKASPAIIVERSGVAQWLAC